VVLACVGLGLGVWLGVDGGGSSIPAVPPYQHFVTRPDLRPPKVTILRPAGRTAPGYVFLAPKKKVAQAGPLIVDNAGQVVWFDPLPTKGVADFKVQRYRGRPVLTWWQGQVAKGHGVGGGYAIMDDSYRLVRVVRAGNGFTGDIHDFQLTARGTALMTVYNKVPFDLSSVGGPAHGYVLEGIVQEISLTTGKVLFEWHSAAHVSPSESYEPLGPKTGFLKAPYDYFHVNSVQPLPDGNLLVSARHTSTVYEIRRSDGAILWRLGGKKSDFAFGPGAAFRWQHDARLQPDGTLTVFDNAATSEQAGIQTQALVLRVDAAGRRVTLVRSYEHGPPLLSTSQGDQQRLPDGHVFVGWGSNPFFTEFARDGTVLLDGRFGTGADSYRAFRFAWVGRPKTRPALVVRHTATGRTAYVSWNGATEVARWQVLAGSDPRYLAAVGSAVKRGFETAIPLGATAGSLAAVRALDASGAVLGRSTVVHAQG
jgi:hypothetical protein